jgi:hypothetical protein
MTVLLMVVHYGITGVPDRVIHIEKLSPLCRLEHFAVGSVVSASDTVHVDYASWRIGKWAEPKGIDATGEPEARPIDGLR